MLSTELAFSRSFGSSSSHMMRISRASVEFKKSLFLYAFGGFGPPASAPATSSWPRFAMAAPQEEGLDFFLLALTASVADVRTSQEDRRAREKGAELSALNYE